MRHTVADVVDPATRDVAAAESPLGDCQQQPQVWRRCGLKWRPPPIAVPPLPGQSPTLSSADQQAAATPSDPALEKFDLRKRWTTPKEYPAGGGVVGQGQDAAESKSTRDHWMGDGSGVSGGNWTQKPPGQPNSKPNLASNAVQMQPNGISSLGQLNALNAYRLPGGLTTTQLQQLQLRV